LRCKENLGPQLTGKNIEVITPLSGKVFFIEN
jgi:hypothetical protein